MTGEDVEKMSAAKHNEAAGPKARHHVQAAHSHPTEHECTNCEYMQRSRPVNGSRQRQNQKQPVRRIEQRSLHSAKIWSAAKDMRIPES